MASDVAHFPVVDVPDRHHFEIHDGDRVAGFTDYRRRGSLIAFIHTEVADEYEGRGAASRLISGALDAARDQGLSVLPFCPFVRGYIAKHPDRYLDLVPERQREDFDLPARADTSES